MVEKNTNAKENFHRPDRRHFQNRRRFSQGAQPSPAVSSRKDKIAYIFPGQGSQYVGMGKKLAENYPAAAAVFRQADEILGLSLSRLCFERPEEELRRTANAQPALLTCSLAILAVLKEKGPKPDLLAGHSLGEFAAWVAADSLQFAAALPLVRRRAELMEQAASRHPGGMLAVLGVQPQALKQLISKIKEGRLVIANLNCPGQIVVSGEEAALRKLRETVVQIEGRAVPLRVSGAFHSPLMEEAAAAFRQEINKVRLSPARIPVVCNISAKPVSSPEAIRQAMAEQMTSPVLWEASLQKMAQLGVIKFLEVGPGEVLCGLVKRTLDNVESSPTGEPEKLEEALTKLAQTATPSSGEGAPPVN
jgi:[acyl-carrier-protein] S-malonyltransferase